MTDAVRAEFRRQAGGLVAMAVACALFLAFSQRFLELACTYAGALSVSGPGLMLGLVCVSVAAVLSAISATSSRGTESVSVACDGDGHWARLWTARCCVGGVFAIVLACLFAFLVFLLFLQPGSGAPGFLLVVLSLHGFVFVALEAFAWGMFWSKPARSPMLSLGLTVISLILIWALTTSDSEWSASAMAASSMVVRPVLACIVLYRSWRAAAVQSRAQRNWVELLPVLGWKEMREHWSVWLAMAAVNAAIVLSADRFLANDNLALCRQIQFLAVLVAPAVYGLVCAGLMLAGEIENRTLSCLDALTPLRTEVWKCKCGLGALFTAAQAVVSACFLLQPTWLLEHGLTTAFVDITMTVTPFGLFALMVFAVGLVTSVVSRTVLGAVARGFLVVPVLGWVFVHPPLHWAYSPIDLMLFDLLLYGAIVSVALYVSWLRFCSADRSRQETADDSYENGAAAYPHDSRDVLSSVGKALAFGGAIGTAILLIVCCVVMPVFASWANLVATIMVWLIVPARSFLNATARGVSSRSSSPRFLRTPAAQALLAAGGIALAVWFLTCLLTLYFEGLAANPFREGAIMQIPPAAAVLFTSWWLLCRGNQKTYPRAMSAWLLATWVLFVGAEISACVREAGPRSYILRDSKDSVPQVAMNQSGTVKVQRSASE